MMSIYIILVILLQFLIAYAQYNLKLGSRTFDIKKGLSYNIKNWPLVFSLLLFLMVPFFSVLLMRKMEFSVFYSFTAVNYLFIMFFSWKVLKEKFDRLRIIGNILVVLGIVIFNLK